MDMRKAMKGIIGGVPSSFKFSFKVPIPKTRKVPTKYSVGAKLGDTESIQGVEVTEKQQE